MACTWRNFNFFQTTFHHHFQDRNAKISPIFHFEWGHNGRICHILCVKYVSRQDFSFQYEKKRNSWDFFSFSVRLFESLGYEDYSHSRKIVRAPAVLRRLKSLSGSTIAGKLFFITTNNMYINMKHISIVPVIIRRKKLAQPILSHFRDIS